MFPGPTAQPFDSACQLNHYCGTIVLVQLNLPTGAARLSKNHPDLKTLHMSGYTANVIAHHGIIDEGVQFIQKPFSLKNLAKKVREVIEQGDGSASGFLLERM